MLKDCSYVFTLIKSWVEDYALGAGFSRVVCQYQNSNHFFLIKNIFNHSKIQFEYYANDLYWLAEKASIENALVLGLVDRSFGCYYRSFPKWENGLCDIFPLYDLEYSEIIQLLKHIDEKTDCISNDQSAKNLEFCNLMEEETGIITSPHSPTHHPSWNMLIHSQKEWIAKVHQREKKTRHKKILKPYPQISKELCQRRGV